MAIDQRLMTASEPNDHGLSRWTRVLGMVNAPPTDPLREHVELLIEQSTDIPEQVKN